MALALAQNFLFEKIWCIVPEFTLTGNLSLDYFVSNINIDKNSANYGISIGKLLAEIKDHAAVLWRVLLNKQLWN